jgi:hypothetical protein
MKKYLTSVVAIHNITGQLGKWPGPIIEAESMEEAVSFPIFRAIQKLTF